MSRGPGATQRGVLELVASKPEWFPVSEVAAHLYGPEPTTAQRTSLRRAVAGLRSRGMVQTKRAATTDSESGGWRFTTDPPLTPEQVKDWQYGSTYDDEEGRWVRLPVPATRSLYGWTIYAEVLPDGALDVEGPEWWTADHGFAVTWFRLPKRPPRWETWVAAVDPG